MAVRCREAAGAVIHLDDSESLPGTLGSFSLRICFSVAPSPIEAAGPDGAAARANPAATTRPASAFAARRSGDCMAGYPSVMIGAAQAALPSGCCGGTRKATFINRGPAGATAPRPPPSRQPAPLLPRAPAGDFCPAA
jgi:hypothetical protein